MKAYAQFIAEARTTKASSQAKRLGLVGDGHGDWYDKQGNLKAKTVSGELKMFSGRTGAEDEGSKDTSTAAKSGSKFAGGGVNQAGSKGGGSTVAFTSLWRTLGTTLVGCCQICRLKWFG